MKQKDIDNKKEIKELTDEELKNATGGIKIVIDETPSFIRAFLRLIFKVKER